MMRKQQSNSVEKALQIILTFQPDNQELGITEISRILGFHKATVARILKSLVKYDFLQTNPVTKKFQLGKVAVDIGAAIKKSIDKDLVNIAKPHVDGLTGELKIRSAQLEILSGGNCLMVYISKSVGPIVLNRPVGDMHPAHASAGGKTLLAFQSSEFIDKFLMQPLESLTPNTKIDPIELKKQFHEIKQQGYAIDNEEVSIGLSVIGVPVFNSDDKPVAAVTVCLLSSEMTKKYCLQVIPLIKNAAKKISKSLLMN